jgi:hypothetical protein
MTGCGRRTLLLGALLSTALPAHAGPNSGGTLVVHDTGYWYTWEIQSYPSPPPADCASVDAEMPVDVPGGYSGRVWKIYAAFLPGSSPRLKALALGEDFNPEDVVVWNGGVPNPAEDFEIPQNGWPVEDGGGVGLSFLTVKTALISEVYWLAGYAYSPSGGLWSTCPHPVQQSTFVDDAWPPNEDRIAGFSSIGFGVPGNTICPGGPGACCFPDGDCQMVTAPECAAGGGVFGYGPACDPNPCPPPGACCFPDGHCEILEASPCAALGGEHQGYGTDCDPNPCTQPTVVCCLPDGSCLLRTQQDCEESYGGVSMPELQTCVPNPCPQVDGACCLVDGTCVIMTLVECEGAGGQWFGPLFECEPDPCPPTAVEGTTWGRIKRFYH